jgi:hypothetical protein
MYTLEQRYIISEHTVGAVIDAKSTAVNNNKSVVWHTG